MRLFKKTEELTAELEKSAEEVERVKEKTPKIDRLGASLQGHLKDNNFAPRVYAQLAKEWK